MVVTNQPKSRPPARSTFHVASSLPHSPRMPPRATKPVPAPSSLIPKNCSALKYGEIADSSLTHETSKPRPQTSSFEEPREGVPRFQEKIVPSRVVSPLLP